MHEFSIIENIFKTIDKIASDNQLKVITKVTLKVGKMRQIIPDFLRFAFETIAKNTLAANAELIIEEIPMTVRCHRCDKISLIEELILICPNCVTTNIEIISGKELILETIEGE